MSSARHLDSQKLLLVSRRAHAVMDRLSPSVIPQETSGSTGLSISPPSSILPTLLARGVSPKIAEHVSAIYFRYSASLQQRLNPQLQAILRSAPPEPERYCSVYQMQHDVALRQWFERFMSGYNQRVKVLLDTRRADSLDNPQIESKPSASSHTLQPLEKAFAKNPYPTREAKEQLAKITGMEFKQVHNWFQNHRNRSKKSGSSTVKEHKFINHRHIESSELFVRNPDTSLPDTMVPSVDRGCPAPHGLPNPLDPARPSYTFPTPYSPDREACPPTTFETPWLRYNVTHVERGCAANLEEEHLVALFSNLRISECSTSSEVEYIRIHPQIYHCFSPVQPSTAPHPALLRAETQKRKPLTRVSTQRRTRSRVRIGQPSKTASLTVTKSVVGVSRNTAHPYIYRRGSSNFRSLSSTSMSSRSSRSVSNSSSDCSLPHTPPPSHTKFPKFVFYKPDTNSLSSPTHSERVIR